MNTKPFFNYFLKTSMQCIQHVLDAISIIVLLYLYFLGITAQLLPQNAFYLEHFSRCKSTVSSQEMGNLFIYYTRNQYFIELLGSLCVSSLHPVVLTISYYTLIRLPNLNSLVSTKSTFNFLNILHCILMFDFT